MSARAGWRRYANPKLLGLIAQVTISALLLKMVLTDVKLDVALSTVRQLPMGFLLLAFGVLLGMQLGIVLRWWTVLRAVGGTAGYVDTLKITLVGFLFNNVVPGLMGQDAARVYYAGRGASYVDAGASVLFDKILGLLVMASFAGVVAGVFALGAEGLLGLPQSDPAALALLNQASLICLLASGALVLGLVFLMVPVERMLRPERMARPWMARSLAALIGLVVGLRSCVRPRVLGMGYLVGIVCYGALALVYARYMCLTGEAGSVAPGFWAVFSALALTLTLTNLPISFNGIGIREHAHVVFFAALGMGKEAAVGIALVQYASLVGLSLLGLVVWLSMKGHGKSPSCGTANERE